LKTKDIVLVALCCALIIVMGLIPPLPMPGVAVPLTLQTFGVMLVALLLGPRRAGLVLLLYVGMALIGLPVLPGGRAGMAVLAGPTGGFLLGMVPGAVLTGWLRKNGSPVSARAGGVHTARWQILRDWLACLAGGLVLVYACGIPWMAAVTGMSLSKAFGLMLVFVPGDMLKALVASIIAARLGRLNLT